MGELRLVKQTFNPYVNRGWSVPTLLIIYSVLYFLEPCLICDKNNWYPLEHIGGKVVKSWKGLSRQGNSYIIFDFFLLVSFESEVDNKGGAI